MAVLGLFFVVGVLIVGLISWLFGSDGGKETVAAVGPLVAYVVGVPAVGIAAYWVGTNLSGWLVPVVLAGGVYAFVAVAKFSDKYY